MDDEELSLPTLPSSHSHLSQDPQLPSTNPKTRRQWSRKRSTRSYELQQDDDANSSSIHTSSDPALFSSDETPDAENYSGGKRRKKKTYAGTWWGERFPKTRSRTSSRGASSNASSRKVKRRFTRNFDSGIFMNSDDGSTELSSDSSFGADLLEDQRRTESFKSSALPQTPGQQGSKLCLTFGSPSSSPRMPRSAQKPSLVDAREQHVISVVRKCLDDSREDVDLSDLSLQRLPLEIRELATMIKDDPASPMQFDSLVARPRLYLANNLLREFPTPLLELSNLRLLSLRQNKLARLPPGIRNLVKLETLNVSGNRLEFLPIEVLDLMSNHRLVVVQSEPNPWLTCSEEQKRRDPGKTRISNRPRLYVRGHTNQDDEGYHTLLSLVASNRRLLPIVKSGSPTKTKVPSLSELVLRQLSKSNQSKRDLTPLMPEGTGPRVIELLEDLHHAQIEGDRQCARCKRRHITPAEKWIEWWDIRSKGMSSNSEELHQIPIGPGGGHVLPFEVGVCENCV